MVPTLLCAALLVRVLELFHPAEAVVAGERLHADAMGAPRTFSGPVVVELPGRGMRRAFPGRLHVRASAREPHELLLRAEVDVEDYVASVVAAEMAGHAGAPEALRAQAVLARTFALDAHARPRHEGYDLCDTTHCQVWRGRLGDAPPAFREAAEATRGLVLLWRGEPAAVYYHAHCGGRTADPADLWPGHPRLPYLAAKDDPHPDDPRTWIFSLPRGDILNIQPRVDRVPESVRLALGRRYGWSRVPSGGFTVSEEGGRVLLSGHGAGHGAGLCQQGALRMAAAGAPFREILRFYFPGTEVGPTMAP